MRSIILAVAGLMYVICIAPGAVQGQTLPDPAGWIAVTYGYIQGVENNRQAYECRMDYIYMDIHRPNRGSVRMDVECDFTRSDGSHFYITITPSETQFSSLEPLRFEYGSFTSSVNVEVFADHVREYYCPDATEALLTVVGKAGIKTPNGTSIDYEIRSLPHWVGTWR